MASSSSPDRQGLASHTPDPDMPRRPSQLPDFIPALEQQGYHSFRQVGGTLCCLYRMNFTHALIVGIDVIEYRYRYCYEFESDAAAALASWNGQGHPPGPWIKRKGAGIDELNPDLDPPEPRYPTRIQRPISASQATDANARSLF